MKKTKKVKSELNIFHYGMYRRINIKQFFRNCKYAWQRATRGYSDWDTWDLDTYYTKLLIESLEHFITYNHSYPGIEPWETSEKWQAYINEIIQHLKNYYYEESNDYYKQGQEYYEQANKLDKNNTDRPVLLSTWLDFEHQSYEYRLTERHKAFAMLDKCWDHLWD